MAETDHQGREIALSTTTETEFLDENAPKNGTAPTVGSDQEQEQPGQFDEHDHDHDGTVDAPHEHTHVFIREDGTVSPMCLGGGCPTKLPAR
jgi:hypothetical protein